MSYAKSESSRRMQVDFATSDIVSLDEAAHRDHRGHWWNIIFLPFDSLWEFCVICAVFLNVLLVVYDVAYDDENENDDVFTFIHYACEIIFFLDTVLRIAHRNMPSYREIREHQPKNLASVVVDAITLLPIYEIYLLIRAMWRKQDSVVKVRNWVRLKILFRLYRVYEYFSKTVYHAGINQMLVVCVGHYIKMVIVTQIVAAIWYLMGCWKCSRLNWTVNLEDFHFDTDSPLEWLVICYTTIGNINAQSWRGKIRAEVPSERVVILVLMGTGFVLHTMYYFGQVTHAFVKAFRHQHVFVDKLDGIKRLLDEYSIDEECREKTVEYYKVFWEKRHGIRRMPPMFEMLPLPLKKEVTVDIYWEALRHSHLFGEEEISFKRAIGLEMRSEFYLPGDYVFRRNSIKSKLVYISTGILQVLTAEDEESPIISFSSGSVLGEASCLFPCLSAANVRCATYCELQTLSIYSLYKVLKDYPGKARALQARINRRFVYARHRRRRKKEEKTPITNFLVPVQDPSIRWLKRQWRHLAHRSRESTGLADSKHCSEFLDLIVLSEEVELKMQVICLRESCPFVLEPNSSFRVSAHYMVILATIIQSILIPYYVAFHRRIPGDLFAVCFFLDLVYFADIYMKVSTAINTRDRFISSPGEIFIEKTKDVRFLIDLLATFPVDYIAQAFNVSEHVMALLKLNRLLKMYMFFSAMNSKENSIWLDSFKMRLFKYFSIYVLICYWYSCLEFMTTCFHKQCEQYGWMEYNDRLDMDVGIPVDQHQHTFIISLGYVMSTYLSLLITRRHQYIIVDMIVHHILVLLSYFSFTYCSSGLCATYVLLQEKQINYKNYYASAMGFLKMNNIPAALKERIVNTLQFWWYHNQNAEFFSSDGLLVDCTDELAEKIVHQRIRECLESLPLFFDTDPNVINTLLRVIERKVIPQNTPVITHGYRPSRLVIILRGYCKMKSYMPGDLERGATTTFKAGDAFPVAEFFHQTRMLSQVTSITACEIIYIRYSDLVQIIQANVILQREMAVTLESHFKTYETVLLGKRGRLPEMVPAQHSLGPGDLFTFNISDDTSLDPEEMAYLKPFLSLGRWSFIRYLLLKSTIDPHGKFFGCWEVYRCIYGVCWVILTFTYFNVLWKYRQQTDRFLITLYISAVVDIYIRMHCRYYNQKGMLVTHPWFTAKHYFNTSFVVDCCACFPYHELQVDQILGLDNRFLLYTILALIARPLNLHRVMGYINYLQSNIEKAATVLLTVKYVIMIVTIVGLQAVIIQLLSCTLMDTTDAENLVCSNKSWISTMYFQDSSSTALITLKCWYASLNIFTTVTTGAFTIIDYEEVCIFLVLYVAAFILRMLVNAKLISRRIGGNVNLTIQQEQVKSFLNFIERECIDEDLVEDTIEHHRYIWRRTQGTDVKATMNKFDENLHGDIGYLLFGPTLEAVEIFQGLDVTFFRQVCMQLQVHHYKKDSQIIRCNDVQGNIHIVYKGKIDIFVAKTKTCTLSQGGLFGCMEKNGITRQTITAIAKVHSALLVIDSTMFHKVIGKHVNLTRRLRQSNFFHSEYSESKRRVFFGSQTAPSRTSVSSRTSNVSQVRGKGRSCCLVRLLIKPEEPWYQLWHYLMYVHVASISSICYMFYTTIWDSKTINPAIRAVTYVTDLLFLADMFFTFHCVYVDAVSGVVITDYTLILKRYLRGWFWFDLLTIFPFELITGLITSEVHYVKYAMINRELRFVYLVCYYRECQEKLKVQMHLRWTYFIYLILINVQVGASLWWLVACPKGQCHYLKTTKVHDNANYKLVKPGINSILVAYEYVITLFTSTGLQSVNPLKTRELVVTIVIICFYQCTGIFLTGEFATMISIQQFTLSQYESSIRNLRTYLQVCSLSPAIIDKVWTYCLQLWQRQRGEWMPEIVKKAPAYLKQDIMLALYDHHLRRHYLFSSTHVDFLRQVAVHLHRCVFFPGNCLAEKGDIDGSMFFIHDGEVEVYDVNQNSEIPVKVLKKNQSFGEAQGLHNIPHRLTYKARTVVDALILKRQDWQYLLEWFPASKQFIFQKAAKAGIKTLEQYKKLQREEIINQERRNEILEARKLV